MFQMLAIQSCTKTHVRMRKAEGKEIVEVQSILDSNENKREKKQKKTNLSLLEVPVTSDL